MFYSVLSSKSINARVSKVGPVPKISGERRKEEDDREEKNSDDKWHHAERQSGSFLRQSQLPENSKLDEIRCRLENGLLSVEVPKQETGENRNTTRNVDVA
ncbi:hypothetical protein RHSIM_Rhsim11G0089900 [Rhododendron simsii]|uniref:SHSP domain-containing protein n=1 Tax=Rhododendron simsii TaxID=118357 RepID=A0A834LAJ4_RHOSS|nr:hypothetical protein RHSIM_Rhsim11G0089900 [Rhododendron simsii]